jgi:hypothetical protein
MPMKEGKVAHVGFPPRWDDVFHDDLVSMQKGNLACTNSPTDGIMLFVMSSCLCKKES